MNNKGFIRILEAVVAIVIIFMFTYYIIPRDVGKSDSEEERINLLQRTILNEFSYNQDFRDCILGNEWTICRINIENYIKGLEPRYQYGLWRCGVDRVDCELEPNLGSKNIYVSEMFVAQGNNKQRVRIYIGK